MIIDILWFVAGVGLVVGMPIGIIFLLSAGGGR